MRTLGLSTLCLARIAILSIPVVAAAQSDSADRDRIARDRAGVEQAYLTQERECENRFAVTSCVEEARRVRRNALSELRRQATVLDEVQRKQRAEQRRKSIRDNLARDEAEQRALAERGVREPRIVPMERAAPAPRPGAGAQQLTPPKRPEPRASAPSVGASGPTSRALEIQNRDKYESRQRDAQAHRQDVIRRNEEKAARREPAAPLPLPAASKP